MVLIQTGWLMLLVLVLVLVLVLRQVRMVAGLAVPMLILLSTPHGARFRTEICYRGCPLLFKVLLLFELSVTSEHRRPNMLQPNTSQ
jgi:hypothetical protein